MQQALCHVTVLVRNYDEAIAFYVEKVGFQLVEDTPLGDGKRWVLVRPRGASGSNLLLAEASTTEQEARVGDQSGGRVFLFLRSDDFWRDYHSMKAHGVVFLEEPRQEAYGMVVVWQDLYGNKWDLLEQVTAGES